ncbi:hypothetical protein [Moorena bouillonii]|uniref:Uncharacterized protein n=1 Tax=Moorena bouillonii PNG TaxID=568701 RepID=A0A1U7N9I0_9CYAN|nr:hypothetical protein [Moorena bouillonii]OLT62607.1 hypothetical protein BJP37_29845 [Moorena bouillonii PNG]
MLATTMGETTLDSLDVLGVVVWLMRLSSMAYLKVKQDSQIAVEQVKASQAYKRVHFKTIFFQSIL